MKLYLMRHCLADDGDRMDSERELDDIGREQAKVMKRWLDVAQIEPDIVLSSDFLRAHETAKVINRGVDIQLSKALRPDSTPEKAMAAILGLAGDAERVFVVTHGPLIQPLLAAVAFQFHDHYHWEHGAIGYVNTHKGRFRWFMDPKLAARIIGEDPVKVDAGEAAAFGRECVRLAENLTVAHKAAAVNPLIATVSRALTARWRRQRLRVLKTLPGLKPAIAVADVAHVTAMVQAALPLLDLKFARTYRAARIKGYTAGAEHVHAQLGYKLAEAPAPVKRKTPFNLQPIDDGDDLERGLDDTTQTRVQTTLASIADKGFEYAAVAAGLRSMFQEFSNPAEGVSRADTVALGAVSDAYHEGGADVASAVRSTGEEVEKHWDTEDDPCEICIENEADDWIPEDAPHSSGDFEPQAHPNCQCSESYRIAPADEDS